MVTELQTIHDSELEQQSELLLKENQELKEALRISEIQKEDYLSLLRKIFLKLENIKNNY